MLKNVGNLILLFLCSLSAFAVAEKTSPLRDMSLQYRAAQLVEMSVEKVVKSELMGRETKYEGKIFLSQGKFRWENSKPQKSLLVFDGKFIWSEQSPPAELGGTIQVARGRVDKRTSAHRLISSLMGGDLEKNFKVFKEENEGGLLRLSIGFLEEDPSIQSLQIVISPSSKTLKKVSYKDDLGNETTLNFDQVKFLNRGNKLLFKYQPPKGVQVTEL